MTAMTMPVLPAAGWYPDPRAPGVQRYWNGQAWTESVAAQQQQTPMWAVTESKRHTSHTFHLLMTVLTFGMWGVFVWLPMTVINALRKEKSMTRIR